MTSPIYHETLYRSHAAMTRLKEAVITVCGAGALGANIVEGLARVGCQRLRVIDHDRIEARNLSTQPFYRSDIGAFKAHILANAMYRAVGTSIEARMTTLTDQNAPGLLKESMLAIDAFDNSAGRRAIKEACATLNMPCVHVGLASAGYGEVVWNERYRVPSDANETVCDYPLARNLVVLTVSVACEVSIQFVTTGARKSYTITLADLAIRDM